MNKTFIALFFLLLPLFGHTAELIADKSVLTERDCFGRNFEVMTLGERLLAISSRRKLKMLICVLRD